MIAVMLIGSALVLVGFEYALRFVTKESKGPVKYQSHPTALTMPKPNLRKSHTAWGEKHYYRTNEVGIRDDNPLCEQPDVLLFGDSNLFASFLPFEETLGEQLEDNFDDAICSANFGVPGYGPDQSLQRMFYEVDHLGLTPQVVVFHVFADNDYGDFFRNYLYTLDASGDLQATSRDKTDFKLRTWERLAAQYLLVRRLRDVLASMGFYQLPANEYAPENVESPGPGFASEEEMFQYIASMEQRSLREFERYQQGQYTTWLADTSDFYIALNPETEAASQAGKMLEGVFTAAKEQADALGACFVVLIQPAESDVAETGLLSPADLTRYSQAYGRSYRPQNLTDIAKVAAESAGVDYIDLFALYENATVRAYEPFAIDNGDNHWNAAGVKIAADALQRYIAEKACITTSAQPAP
ncbi:Uncharacterised protein [Halioglobus japonicus]|nr:Uncharacterised protein [Halioglobus japonicus]